MPSKNEKHTWLPKAKDFSPRFKWALIAFFIAVILIIILVMNLSTPDFNETAATDQTNKTSMLAVASIDALDAQKEPIILLKNWTVIVDGKQYPVFQKNGALYAKMASAKVALHNGAIIYRHGVPYLYENGHLGPLKQKPKMTSLTGPQAGDIVEKNGRFYQVGNDGKLHAYTAHLQKGQIVWKDGKPYRVGVDGKLHAIGSHAQAGDLLEKNGQLYQIGSHGKLHAYHGHLKAGQLVWKGGKAYVVGADGQLHAVGTHPQVGDLIEKNGHFFRLGQDGKLHPYLGTLAQGQEVWKNGVPYIMGADGHLHRLTEGATRAIRGKAYYWKNGHWIPYSSNGAKAGDLIEKKGKLYQLGSDGKLHVYQATPQPGQVVWKNGQPYRVNAQGELEALRDGQSFTGADGKQYRYQNGKIVLQQQKPKHSTHDAPLAGENAALESAFKSSLVAYQKSFKQTSAQAPITSYQNSTLESNLSKLQSQSDKLSQSLVNASNQYGSQNGQGSKVAFLQSSSDVGDPSKAKLKHPSSPYTLFAGSLIPATLETGINSDLPGTILAKVSQNVYDTATGNYLLIPQGTTVYGRYDSGVSYGQSRVLIVFYRLIFPNGTSINLDNMPGADLSGYAGLTDKVDNHYFRIFGSALMFSVFSAAGQLSQPSTSGQNGANTQQIIYAAVGQNMSQTAAQMLAKNMNIQPTIKIRPGDDFTVLTTRDIVFPSWYRFH